MVFNLGNLTILMLYTMQDSYFVIKIMLNLHIT